MTLVQDGAELLRTIIDFQSSTAAGLSSEKATEAFRFYKDQRDGEDYDLLDMIFGMAESYLVSHPIPTDTPK